MKYGLIRKWQIQNIYSYITVSLFSESHIGSVSVFGRAKTLSWEDVVVANVIKLACNDCRWYPNYPPVAVADPVGITCVSRTHPFSRVKYRSTVNTQLLLVLLLLLHMLTI